MAKKEKKEKVKKKGGAKKFFKGFGIALCVLIVVVGVCVLITYISSESNIKYASEMKAVDNENALSAPTIDEETGYWTFVCDRDFKVMQLTDVHIGGGFMSMQKDNWALNAVATMINEEKPDLVIVTGDLGFPVPFSAGTFNNLIPIMEFSTMMESLQVYWTFTYGNHDTEAYSYYDRKDIDDYYVENINNGKLKYCLYQSGFCGDNKEGYEGIEANAGYGNTIINVKNSSGAITQSFIMIDSHAYESGFFQDYDHIHQCQIDWYSQEINKLNEINKDVLGVNSGMTIKSLAFFHIPLEEYKDAYVEYVENEYKDTDNVTMIFGKMGEDVDGKWIYHGVTPENMFETMLELGSTKGIFCGHDHYNNFSLMYNGGEGDDYIRLTYGMSIDYLAYAGIAKETAQRGCTIITTKTDGTFDCYGLRLVDLEIID